MNPKISIIIPVYNAECYLEKCLDSILAQTFADFELILVDDGSLDQSGHICDAYAPQDNRIKVIHKKNGGVSTARNEGLKAAHGEYIGFVDSDDYINEKMYEILYSVAAKNGSDIVLCDFFILNEKGKVINKRESDRKALEETHYNNIEALEQIFIKDKEYHFGTSNNPKWILLWNKLFKSNLFTNLRFSEGTIYQGYEDERIATDLLFNSKKITYTPNKVYYYVQRQNSLSNFPFSIKKFERVYALKYRVDFFKRKGLLSLHYKALNDYMEAFFWNYYMAKSTLSDVKADLKMAKKTMNHSFLSFMKSPLISWKQKIFIMAFIINPYVLELAKKFE